MKSNYTSTEPRSKLPLTSAIGLIGVAAAAGVYAVRQRRRADFANRNVLIGGASRGLGLELAREFVKQGGRRSSLYEFYPCARRQNAGFSEDGKSASI